MRSTVFLINLDRAVDRLNYMQKQADLLGFAFERVRAVDGRNAPRWLQLEFADDKRMNDGEVGCYASHLVVASLIVGRELDYAVVLEDDAEIDESFSAVVSAAARSAPVDWDFIHLSSTFKKSIIKTDQIGDHALVCYTESPMNATGYILSHRGARKWLAPMMRRRPIDIDNRFAWQQGLKIFGVYPAVVRPNTKLQSQIAHCKAGRGRGHAKLGLGPIWWRLRSRIWNIGEIGLLNYIVGCSLNVVNSVRKRIDGTARTATIPDLRWRTNQGKDRRAVSQATDGPLARRS